ncbi:MAG: hypothetical protein NWE94_06930 [Candidatus Bathyarchaeota archaeon]|nr:hypothetical protein [Candidatus Bathyarchaeota archaeon]
MGVTLDGKTLNVTGWRESLEPIKSEFDKWENGTCKRKVRVYGYVRVYALDCIEENVAWASSVVKYFEEKAAAGAVVAFFSDLAVRNVSSTNVQVVGVGFEAVDVGSQNVRSFSLQLQEVL